MRTNKILPVLVIAILVLTMTSIVSAQSQEKLGIGAGATFNKQEGLDMGIGYYASLNTTGKINKLFGYSGILQFSNYHAKFEDIAINYYSLDPTFLFQIYPGQESFSLLAGVSAVFLLDAKVDGEEVDVTKDGGIYFATGASFNVGEKFTILARYNIPFQSEGFDYTASVGAIYKF